MLYSDLLTATLGIILPSEGELVVEIIYSLECWCYLVFRLKSVKQDVRFGQ